MTILLFCLSLFFVPPLIASTWSTFYGGTDYDDAASVKATGDGGCIVAGNSGSFGAGSQAWVLKIHASGTVEWQKTYTNTDKESYHASSIDLISDGGCIIAGSVQTCYETDGPLCQGYGWLAKLTAAGEIVWQKGVKDMDGYGSSFSAVHTTGDNGFIAVGSGGTVGTVTATSKLWVVKVDADGAVQWQRFYHNDNITDSFAHSVAPTQDGGYVVAGALFSALTGWSDGYDIWALKLDINGNVEWHAMYRSPAGYDIGYSVQQTADGGYAIGGQTEDAMGYGTDGLVVKLSSEGAIEWQKTYETNSGDGITQIQQTNDGGYIVGGLYQTGGVAAKLNHGGAIEWTHGYQCNRIVSMTQTADNMFMISEDRSIREGISSVDVLLLKTDETGTINTCLSVVDADVQVSDASLTVNNFTITAHSPDLRIINTLAVSTDTAVMPVQQCPYKSLALVLSTSQAYALSSPEGMHCVGRNCSGLYPGGSIVELTVYHEAGASTTAWGGDCAGCPSEETSCSVYMDGDKTCTAVFAAQKGDIDGNGTAGLGDAVLALQSIAGRNPAIPIGYGVSGADVNGNNTIDQAEAIYALQKTAMLRPPFAPTGVTAIADIEQATISWNAVQGATAYHIYWATTPAVTKTGGIKIACVASPYIHTGLTRGTTYYYIVTAEDSSGESAPSAEVSATPFTGWIQTGLNAGLGRSLYVSDSSDIYAATYDGVFSASDDGMPWISRGLAGTDVSDIIRSNEYILAATLEGIYRSSDNGITWTLMNGSPGISAGGGIYGPHVFAKNSTHLFIIAWARGIFRSDDDGATWEQVHLGSDGEGYQDYAASATFVSTAGEQVFINGKEPFSGGGGSVIWSSSDNGATWSYSSSPSVYPIQSLHFDNGNLFACGTMGVYLSTDLGNSWSTQYSNTIGQQGELLGLGTFRNIISYNDALIAAVDFGSIHISRDNGITWAGFNEGLISDWTFTGLAIKPPYIWALSEFGNAYRRLLSEVIPN